MFAVTQPVVQPGGSWVTPDVSRLDVPVYTGFPFGHCPEKLTLPVGGRCAITVRDGHARLVLSDYGHRP